VQKGKGLPAIVTIDENEKRDARLKKKLTPTCNLAPSFDEDAEKGDESGWNNCNYTMSEG